MNEWVHHVNNFDYKIRRDHQRHFQWAFLLIGKRQEPILDYVSKINDNSLSSIIKC